MANKIIKTGYSEDANDVLVKAINRTPYHANPHVTCAGRLVVGTDFTSGDNLVITIQSCHRILYAHFVSDTGGSVAYTRGEDGTTKTLTIAGATASVSYHIITAV